MMARISAGIWVLFVVIFASAAGIVTAGFGTPAGRYAISRFGISLLNDVVDGTVVIDSVKGTLVEGLEAHGVVVRGYDGTMLARLPRVELQYRLRDLLRARFSLGRVLLDSPQVELQKSPRGRFNFEEVLRLGERSPSAAAPPLVAFRDVEIRNGSVVIRTEHMMDADSVPSMVVRTITGLDGKIDYARISSPFATDRGLRFDIDDLQARLSDPELDFRRISGRLDLDGDSVRFALRQLALTETEGRAAGVLSWPDGKILLRMRLDADRLGVNDAKAFADQLPWNMTGSGIVEVESIDAERLRVTLSRLAMAGPGDSVGIRGTLGLFFQKDEPWRLEETALELDHLDLGLLRPMVPELPFDGWLSGEFKAVGPQDSIATDVAFVFWDRSVDGAPRSDISGSGSLGIGAPYGLVFHGFVIDSSDLDFATIQNMVQAIGLQGDLAASGTLRGPWQDFAFDGKLTHTALMGARTAAEGSMRVDSRSDTVGLWVDMRFDSLDFAGIHESYPAAPQSGRFSGDIWLNGFADQVAFRMNLRHPDEQVLVNGDLVLLPGVFGGSNLRVEWLGWNAQGFRASLPPTDIFGSMYGSFSIVGDSLPTADMTVSVDTSFVAGSPIDSVVGDIRFGNTEAEISDLVIGAPGLHAVVQGVLGRGVGEDGRLNLQLEIDSLATVEMLLRNRLPWLDRDSLLYGMNGGTFADVTVTGTVDDYRVQLEAEILEAHSIGGLVEGVSVSAAWDNHEEGDLVLDVRADSVGLGRWAYGDLDFDLSGIKTKFDWFTRARLGRYGSWLARGTATSDSSGWRIPVEFMGLLLPTHRWFLDSGAVVAIDPNGFLFDGATLRSEDGTALVSLSGVIPKESATGELNSTFLNVPLADVWGFAQSPPKAVDGRFSGDLSLSGTGANPVFSSSLSVDAGRYGSVRIPRFEGEVSYADRRLMGEYGVWSSDEQILEISSDLPLNLALTSVDRRLIDGLVKVDAAMDGVDLSFLELMTPAVKGVGGNIDGAVGLEGTWDDPRLTGNLSVADARGFFPGLGVTHRDVNAHLSMGGDTIYVDRVAMTSGDGQAEVSGYVHLEGFTRPILALDINVDRFRTVDIPEVLAFTITGDLALRGPFLGAELTGAGTVTNGDLYFADIVEKDIINLEDTLYASLVDFDVLQEEGLTDPIQIRMLDSLKIRDLALTMGSNVRMLSSEADIVLDGDVLVNKDFGRYRIDGTLNTPRGTYRLPLGRQMAGLIVRDFRVTRGEVQYFGTSDLNARIDITAERNVTPERAASIRIFVNVGGTLHEPTVAFSSDAVPPLPEEELISYLVFNAPSIESFGAQQLLTQDLFGVFSDRISVEAERLIISNLGVPFDYIRARPLSEEGLVPTGVEFAVGIQIWPRAYLSFSPRICPSSSDIPLSRNTGVGVDYRMTRNWHLSVSQEPVNTCSATEAISSTARSQFGFDFFWEKRY